MKSIASNDIKKIKNLLTKYKISNSHKLIYKSITNNILNNHSTSITFCKLLYMGLYA